MAYSKSEMSDIFQFEDPTNSTFFMKVHAVSKDRFLHRKMTENTNSTTVDFQSTGYLEKAGDF